MSPLLEVQSVDQVFRSGFWMRSVQVLHSITLSVRSGTVFGFLGANGAGKTTLIHLIAGVRRPAGGTVRLRGIDTHTREARARIGYLPERPYFHDHLTGEGLLRYLGTLSGLSGKKLADRIGRVLAVVDMKAARNLELRKYSKGMLQRIGIAQAILHDPEFLVLDEPMSGLDPLGRKEIRELIQLLAAEGHTLFFSSHVIPDVEAVCSEVAWIEKGRLMGVGTIDALLDSRESRVEVLFSPPDLAKDLGRLPGVETAGQAGDAFRAVCQNQEAVDRLLERILASKGRVHSVVPMRPSLESLFITTGATGAKGAKRGGG